MPRSSRPNTLKQKGQNRKQEEFIFEFVTSEFKGLTSLDAFCSCFDIYFVKHDLKGVLKYLEVQIAFKDRVNVMTYRSL
jgi:hypothetical protein